MTAFITVGIFGSLSIIAAPVLSEYNLKRQLNIYLIQTQKIFKLHKVRGVFKRKIVGINDNIAEKCRKVNVKTERA